MITGPSLGELRARVHKSRHREIGNWLARRVGRPSAVYGTWLAVRLGLSAHAVTLGALVSSLGSAVAIGSGSRSGFALGAILAQLAFWLDHVDGQVARWRGTSSLDGVYFDYLMHHVASLSLGFALGYGLAARTGDLRWSAAGFLIATAWLVLNLHNDCRYKAFFQRLKRETGSFRVDGGAAYRPAPPSAWPTRGWGIFTWPAYKSCEPHVVLLGLSALGLIALWSTSSWLFLWKIAVFGMSLMAPTLAVARVARALSRRSVANEFEAWFRPLGENRGESSADFIDSHR